MSEPWHDTPRCACSGPMVLVTSAGFNHRANPGDRIVCCACGTGRVGTDAEVEQARKADAAWEAERVRWHLPTSAPKREAERP